MLNSVIIAGRMTRDPELRYTHNNKPVASFTVACDRDFSGKQDKITDFIDCVAWNSTGEFVSNYFRKGSFALVKGRLQYRDWTDRDGNKRKSAEVIADSIYFGGEKKQEDHPPAGTFEELEDDESELPF